VDDGSTDTTASLAQGCGEQVEYVFQENAGPAAARNRGINLARGQFIAFLDADDLWAPARLAEQVGYLQQNAECDVITGRIQYEWLPGAEEPDPLFEAPVTGVHLGTGLFRRSVFERVGVFEESLRFCEDHDWFLRAREETIAIHVLDRVVLRYRRHGGNMTLDREATRRPMASVLQRSLQRRRQRAGGVAKLLPNWNDLDKARCPLITVVIPTFNGERHINRALRSVWRQQYRPIDIIVVDDGSTDGTVAIANQVQHVKVIQRPHEGVASARNAGIRAARSELVAFLDQDDAWLPLTLRAQVDALLNEPELRFVLCRYQPLIEPGSALKEASAREERNYSLSGFLAWKSVFQQIGFFDTQLSSSSDSDWINRAEHGRIPMKFLPETLFERRFHEGNSSQAIAGECELADPLGGSTVCQHEKTKVASA
jgi:glycosyltransferase involved in cell wall biosynthesis